MKLKNLLLNLLFYNVFCIWSNRILLIEKFKYQSSTSGGKDVRIKKLTLTGKD